MNLSQSFPIINKFFQKDSFTDDELNELKEEVIKTYDKDSVKSAISYINLKLLMYEIQDNLPEKQKIKTSNKPNPQKKKKSKKSTSIFIQNISVDKDLTIPKNIKDLARFLNISDSLILSLLHQRGIDKVVSENLNFSEFQKIEEYVYSRIKALKRKDKQEKDIYTPTSKRSKKAYNNKTKPAYERLAVYGMSKLIYIRKQ